MTDLLPADRLEILRLRTRIVTLERTTAEEVERLILAIQAT